jgi:hypothetical protein
MGLEYFHSKKVLNNKHNHHHKALVVHPDRDGAGIHPQQEGYKV